MYFIKSNYSFQFFLVIFLKLKVSKQKKINITLNLIDIRVQHPIFFQELHRIHKQNLHP